jgi:hypothetical protein
MFFKPLLVLSPTGILAFVIRTPPATAGTLSIMKVNINSDQKQSPKINSTSLGICW